MKDPKDKEYHIYFNNGEHRYGLWQSYQIHKTEISHIIDDFGEKMFFLMANVAFLSMTGTRQ